MEGRNSGRERPTTSNSCDVDMVVVEHTVGSRDEAEVKWGRAGKGSAAVSYAKWCLARL